MGWDIAIIVVVLALVLVVGFYFLNRWASRRMADQQEIITKNRTTVSIYVIDKKKEKMQNANFPKAVQDQMPKWNRFMKLPLVKAKIGPQITTLLCDKQVFEALPVKKTVKVDMAGMYIVHMKGMKTKKEMNDLRRARKGEEGVEAPWYRRLLKR